MNRYKRQLSGEGSVRCLFCPLRTCTAVKLAWAAAVTTTFMWIYIFLNDQHFNPGMKEGIKHYNDFQNLDHYGEQLLESARRKSVHRFRAYNKLDKPKSLMSRMKEVQSNMKNEIWSRQDMVNHQRKLNIKDNQKKKNDVIFRRKEELFFDSINLILQAIHRMAKRGQTSLPSDKPAWSFLWGYDCASYVKESRIERMVVYSLWTNFNLYPHSDVTLVVEASLDRYRSLDMMFSTWSGPVSLALYVGPEHIANISDIMQVARGWLKRHNVDVHFVPKQGALYPANFLRNVALNSTKTRYAFICDVDFLPKPSLYDDLYRIINEETLPMYKQVLVIPAFEFTVEQTPAFPDSKTSLRILWDEGQLQPYQPSDNKLGQNSTNYILWKKALKPYKVEWRPGYEPFIFGRKDDLPIFNEKILGRIGDRTSHSLETFANGFRFMVLPKSYIVHIKYESKAQPWYVKCSERELTRHKNGLVKRAWMYQRSLEHL